MPMKYTITRCFIPSICLYYIFFPAFIGRCSLVYRIIFALCVVVFLLPSLSHESNSYNAFSNVLVHFHIYRLIQKQSLIIQAFSFRNLRPAYVSIQDSPRSVSEKAYQQLPVNGMRFLIDAGMNNLDSVSIGSLILRDEDIDRKLRDIPQINFQEPLFEATCYFVTRRNEDFHRFSTKYVEINRALFSKHIRRYSSAAFLAHNYRKKRNTRLPRDYKSA